MKLFSQNLKILAVHVVASSSLKLVKKTQISISPTTANCAQNSKLEKSIYLHFKMSYGGQ